MSECRCGRATRDDAYVCQDCGDALAKALGDVAWLEEELEITIGRQKGVDYRGAGGSSGKKPSERPSPVVWGASEARAHLKAVLVAWALFCDAEDVRNSSPHPGMPDDNLGSLSRWLIWRVDGLTLHEIGEEAVEEITSAVADCQRLIDRPADRQYLGDCEQQDCTGRMWTRPTSEWARCDTCATPVKADDIRADLLKRLDDRLCTAAEIARLSTYLGLKADRDQVRKRISKWAERNLITRHASVTDEVTFRFGEVYERLMADEYGAKRAAS